MTGEQFLAGIDLDEATTLFEPPGDGEGHWVGAPCLHRHDGTTYLAVRWRSPDRRGYAITIHERSGPAEFTELTKITADDLGVVSVERPALVTDPASGDLKLYVPVEHGENDWTVQRLDDAARPTEFDPATARDVLTPEPGTTDAVTVKDPHLVTEDGRYYMFYAGHDGVSEQAHLATSRDGDHWTRSDANPVLGRDGWHDHHTRVSSVLSVPGAEGPKWLLTYDGSGSDDYGATWNLRTGMATAEELPALVDGTPDSPALSAPTADRRTDLEAFGTCRYVDLLVDGDRLELVAEVARPDGSFELRHCVMPWPTATRSGE